MQITEANPLIVRVSELKTFRDCPRKWWFKYGQGWRRPADPESPSNLGSAFHLGMEILYTKGPDAVYQMFDEDGPFSELPANVRETLHWMLDGYIEYYDGDDDWEVVAVEESYGMHVGESGIFQIVAHPDLLVRSRSTGRIIGVDHKTTSSPLGDHEADLDSQFGTYQAILQANDFDVQSIVLNQVQSKKLVRKQTLQERHHRLPSYRTPYALAFIEKDVESSMRALATAITNDDFYSNENPRDCKWKCEYMEAHLLLRNHGPKTAESYLTSQGMVRENVE